MNQKAKPAPEANAPSPKEKRDASSWPWWAGLLVIAAAGALAYSNSFEGPFIFDDREIATNTSIRRLWPPWEAIFSPSNVSRPIVGLSLAINYAVSGLDVWSYHALNLLIHILAALALFGVVRRTLLTGPLEPTNDAYAVAKIAGIKMVQSYRKQYGFAGICAQPTNLFGPNDNFDLQSSHVLPALIRKFHDAKAAGERSVTIWGTGAPRREFLHVDDLADACVFLMNEYEETTHINVGTGEDLSILSLAELVRDVVYPDARIEFDRSKPDGSPRKLLDVSRLHALGWRHRVGLRDGIESTYAWYLESGLQVRHREAVAVA